MSRFTDAELAAEHWRAEYDAFQVEVEGLYPAPTHREADIVTRFAATPSYDECAP